MPPVRSLGGLLLRGSLWTTGMLALWWLALQTPLLAVLRFGAEAALGTAGSKPIKVGPDGDWNLRIPVGDAAGVDAIEFTIPRPDVAAFTFSLPLYWALALAVPVRREGLARVCGGAVLVAMVEVVSLLGFVEITAWGIVARMHGDASALGNWPKELGSYLLVQVIPFVAPIAIALASHRDLQRAIFPQEAQEPSARRPQGSEQQRRPHRKAARLGSR